MRKRIEVQVSQAEFDAFLRGELALDILPSQKKRVPSKKKASKNASKK